MEEEINVERENMVVSGSSGTINITENGITDIAGYANANVNVVPELVTEKDVNFYDYDGTLVTSYSADDFLDLALMPNNPTHTGLTSQGWNWNLSDAKEYVTTYRKLDIGQNYITDNGDTRLYVDLIGSSLNPYVGLYINGTITIDWGDNTDPSTLTGSSLNSLIYTGHTYSTPGKYVISLKPSTGTEFTMKEKYLLFNGNNTMYYSGSGTYYNILYKIEFGLNITTIGENALSTYQHLLAATIPTTLTNFESGSFGECTLLKCLIVPTGTTTLPASFLRYCYCLEHISLPRSLTNYHPAALSNIMSLKSITLPDRIANAEIYFPGATNLHTMIIPNTITTIGGQGFASSFSLVDIKLPNNLTSIPGNCFNTCHGLRKITIPSGVTTVPYNAFNNALALTEVIFEGNITSIGNSAFYGSTALKIIDLTKCTSVPTLENSNALNMTGDSQVVVPDNLYDSWKAASIWNQYVSKIVRESDI